MSGEIQTSLELAKRAEELAHAAKKPIPWILIIILLLIALLILLLIIFLLWRRRKKREEEGS